MLLQRHIRLFEMILGVEVLLNEREFSVEDFLARLQGVVTLAGRGATEGERGASREALTRMAERAKTEAVAMPGDQARDFLARVKSVLAGQPDAATASRRSPSAQDGDLDDRDDFDEYDWEAPPPKQTLANGSWVYLRGKGGLVGQIEGYSPGVAHYKFKHNSFGPTYAVRVAGHGGCYSIDPTKLRPATDEEIMGFQAYSWHVGPKGEDKVPPADWAIIKLWRNETGSRVRGIAANAAKMLVFSGKPDGPFKLDPVRTFYEASKVKSGYAPVALTPEILSTLVALKKQL